METITLVLVEEDSSTDDGEDLKELCNSLQTSSLQLADVIEETYQHFKIVRRKVKEEEYSIDKMPLKPRAHTRTWIMKRGLPEHTTFEDFFATLLEELSKEDRLDLSKRTISPNKDIASLCKIPVDEPIHVIDFLGLVPTLFH